MMKRIMAGALLILALLLVSLGVGYSKSDLCMHLDEKPVLSLNTINQAQFVHMLIDLNPNMSHPTGLNPDSQEYYKAEVQSLIDAGYPPIFGDVEPNHIVTRRYFSSVMFEVAKDKDPKFKEKYGNLSDETARTNALVESEWLYDGNDPNIYYEEVLSVLCAKGVETPPKMGADIVPGIITDAALEGPRSPL
jgi:hypothetical protein